MSVLKYKAEAIAQHLIDTYDMEEPNKLLVNEILKVLKTAGSFQFLEGDNNEIHVKTIVKNKEGKTIAMQG